MTITMSGLDFWAVDQSSEKQIPIFDEWSIRFLLMEWGRELFRNELRQAMDERLPRLVVDNSR
jgi:hypothetical protein